MLRGSILESLQLVASLSKRGTFDKKVMLLLCQVAWKKHLEKKDKWSHCSETRYDKAVKNSLPFSQHKMSDLFFLFRHREFILVEKYTSNN